MKDALTGFVRAVFILFGLLIVFNLLKPVIYSDQYDSSEEDIYSEEGEQTNTSGENTIKPDDKYNYEEIYNKISYRNVLEEFGEEFFDYYFVGKKLDNTFKQYVAIVNLTKNKFTLLCNNKVELSEDEVYKKELELFGYGTYENSSYTSKNGNLVITYDDTNKKFVVENKACSGIKASDDYIETSFVGGKVNENNKIEIYEHAHLVKHKEVDGVLKIINYRGVTEETGEITSNSNYSLYKYVFEITDDKIALVEISRYS